MERYATFHDLEGTSVFITGGGSGIGAALTEGFIAQGAKVAFVQRSDASEFAAEIGARHGTAPRFIRCDITDVAALQAAMAEAATAHGADHRARQQRRQRQAPPDRGLSGRGLGRDAGGEPAAAFLHGAGGDRRACAPPVAGRSSTSPRSPT
jgi:NAD(P)-dependent dehydrogenase (short-subunit alcohol dehydrogenase family)